MAIAGSALAVGTVHTVTLCVATAVLAVAAVCTWWYAEPARARSAANVLLLTGLGLTAFTALQCVPMPIAWLAWIAPHNADVWSRALAPLREAGPRFAPLSVDPIATRAEVLKGMAYLLAFATALRVARSKEGVGFLGAALVSTAVALAASAMLHPAFRAHKLFGVYEPIYGIGVRHIAPLMNPNHLAGYVNVGFCIALSFGIDRDASATRRALGLVVAFLLCSAQLWIASRGGVAAMALGAAVVLVMTRARRGRIRAAPAMAALVTAGGLAMAVLAQSDDAWQELANSDLSKFSLFVGAARLAPLYPFFGAGRGAFESTYPEVRTDLGFMTFTHPENAPLQWTTEWGLPAAMAGAVAVFFALRPSVALARTHGAIGAWAAIVAVGAHNLVDFSSEIPAVMIALACCAGIVTSGVSTSRQTRPRRRWPRPGVVAMTAALAAAAGIAFAAGAIGRDVASDRRSLQALAFDPTLPPSAFRDAMRTSILRHPAEPYLPFAGALRAARAQDENVVPWVARAIERAPIYGSAHALLAHELLRRSPAQARMEYRMAIEQLHLTGYAWRFARDAAPIVGGFDDAMEVVPRGPLARHSLEALAEELDLRVPATRWRLDEMILSQSEPSAEPRARRARDALDDLRAGAAAPWCAADRDTCLRRALEAAHALQAAAPSACRSYEMEASMHLAAGDSARAVQTLRAHLADVSDGPHCLERVAQIAIAAGDDAHATWAIDALARSSCSEKQECVRYVLSAAQIEASRGNDGRALVFYRRAHELEPERDDVLQNIGDTAMRRGLYVEAVVAYTQLVQRHASDLRYADSLTHANEALIRSGAGLDAPLR